MTSPLRILVVEDNPGDVRLVRETLRQGQRWPFELVSEGRLGDGLRRLGRERFDLVLLDLGLPDAHGLSTFEDVQRHAPAIPVVVLTGSDDQETAVQAIQEGAQDYLVKGRLDGDRLWRAIRYAIERKKSEEATRIAYERLGQIEMLKVENTFKLKLISEATHELNTPLTPLLLQAHMLRKGTPTDDPDRMRAIGVLDRNLSRMSHLVQDMLDVARLQSGGLRLERAATDLAPLMAESAQTFEGAAQERGVRLRVQAPGPLPAQADRRRIGQVVDNLVSNAIKFTPEGGTVSLGGDLMDGQVVFTVRDTGIGLSPDEVAQLFQPFVRLHRDRPATPGTGLGLYICRGIVEGHGGTIRCDSPGVGHGCTFTVRIPVTPPPSPSPASTPPTPSESSKPSTSLPLTTPPPPPPAGVGVRPPPQA